MALQDIPLPFGEWLPDLGENNNPGLVEAKNVVAKPAGYQPVRDFDSFTSGDAAAGKIVSGAVGYTLSNGVMFFDYGTETALYVGGTATVTPANTGATSGLGSPTWRFARFDNQIFAARTDLTASTESHVWYHDIGTGTYTNISSQGLRGNAFAKVGRFLMLGASNVTTGSAAPDQFSFRWSAFNNPLDWAPSQTTQAGVATVNDPERGAITGIVGGRSPLLFQKHGVSRLDYVGPPQVWRVQEISRDIGAISQSSIVQFGDLVYFMSYDGVCVTNGSSVSRIGENIVDKWINDNMSPSGANDYITAGILRNSRALVWSSALPVAVEVSSGFTLNFNTHLYYSLETGRFSRGTLPTAGAFYYDAGSNSNIDFALAAGTDGTHEAVELDDDTLSAELTTGYTTLTSGKLTITDTVEPIYDGSGAKVAVNTKATAAGAASAGTPTAVNSLGIAPARASGRLAAVSVTFDAAEAPSAALPWSEFKGAVVTAGASGAR
jgi:hypothetical protein